MNIYRASTVPARAPSSPRLLLLAGSLRRDSHQRRLIVYLAALLEPACQVDVIEYGEISLPLFDQDLEQSSGVIEEVMALHARIVRADGMIVASPEHNSQVSAFLKNTVDWVSRLPRLDAVPGCENAFAGMPLLLVSASTGWTGGVVGLQAARLLFSYLGCLVTSGQICVSDAEQWITEGGFEFAPPFADYIRRVLADFVVQVSQLRTESQAQMGEAGRSPIVAEFAA